LLFCWAVAVAQQTPSAEQLLGAYVSGLGGVEKIRGLKTVAMKGTLDNPDDGSKVPVEVKAKAPDHYVRLMRFSEDGLNRIILAGDSGWNQDPDSGIHPMSKADVANAKLDFDLQRAVRLAELYPKLGAPKRGKLGNSEAWSVEAATDSGVSETWWFDTANGLLLCREYERVTMEDGILKIQEFYSDYKDFDGIKFPVTVRQVMPDYEMLFHFDEVKVNPDVDDSAFRKPE
jgi:hypothetical protein